MVKVFRVQNTSVDAENKALFRRHSEDGRNHSPGIYGEMKICMELVSFETTI